MHKLIISSNEGTLLRRYDIRRYNTYVPKVINNKLRTAQTLALHTEEAGGRKSQGGPEAPVATTRAGTILDPSFPRRPRVPEQRRGERGSPIRGTKFFVPGGRGLVQIFLTRRIFCTRRAILVEVCDVKNFVHAY